MQCKECGNDIMLSIEPEGWKKITRLLPLAEYRCLRCGSTTLRLSAAGYRTAAFKLIFVVLVLAGMGAAVWFSNYNPVRKADGPEQVKVPVESPQEAPAAAEIPGDNEIVAESPEKSGQASLPAQGDPAVIRGKVEPKPPVNATAEIAENDPRDKPAASAVPDAASGSNIERKESVTPQAPRKELPDSRDQAPKKLPAALEAAGETAAETEPAEKPGVNGPETIDSVKIITEDSKPIISLLTDAQVSNVSKFSLASPPRWVVDLPGRWRYKGPTGMDVNVAGAKRVRLGVHPDKFRIVIDYEKQKPEEPVVRTVPPWLLIEIR